MSVRISTSRVVEKLHAGDVVDADPKDSEFWVRELKKQKISNALFGRMRQERSATGSNPLSLSSFLLYMSGSAEPCRTFTVDGHVLEMAVLMSICIE